MRRFNRKGFTLIELLAVIVILGLVMVVTIPSVINTVKASRQGAYEDALIIIEKYVNDEYIKCQIDPESNDDYNSELFDENCQLLSDNNIVSDIILSKTGYNDDIQSVIMQMNNSSEEYEVLYAPVISDGKFKGVEDRKAFEPVTGSGDVSVPNNRTVIG